MSSHAADCTVIETAERQGMSWATLVETRPGYLRGVRPGPAGTLQLQQHIPSDTATPPAPGAVWIGSGDA